MGANFLSMSSFPVFIVVLVSPLASVVAITQVVEVAVAVAVAVAKVVVGR